jgi:hypothetical protein
MWVSKIYLLLFIHISRIHRLAQVNNRLLGFAFLAQRRQSNGADAEITLGDVVDGRSRRLLKSYKLLFGRCTSDAVGLYVTSLYAVVMVFSRLQLH